ncbi:Pituitary homeobox 2 [Pteropus alecto]|uniref:Pituitary homeobox 2 n=1 Tax=Pteropus alecto TaxID=9402 RepID=L5K4G2_PTEAL|nr:Pituitary homeobox 2 [Pteropus alecto]
METNCRKLVSACVQLDSEIKKVEFTDSPESRKEAASSKLFPRQHPGANVTLKFGGGGSGFRAEINRSCRHLVLARGLATRPRADTFARPSLAAP